MKFSYRREEFIHTINNNHDTEIQPCCSFFHVDRVQYDSIKCLTIHVSSL